MIQLISFILLFLLLPLFLAVPTWIIVPGIDYIDAYLDMVGVLTTTGLQVFLNLLSKSIHLWRAMLLGLRWNNFDCWLCNSLPASRGGFDVFSRQKETLVLIGSDS